MRDDIADAEEADARELASITTADELETFLRDRWGEEVLDDHVIESKLAEASQINNEGIGEQIAYLSGGAVDELARLLVDALYGGTAVVVEEG